MDLIKIFETQKELDAHITEKHPVYEGENRLSKKVLALLVELSECANEWRKFKFWSNDQEPRSTLLEEYVDCLHFFVSIGIEMNVDPDELFVPIAPQDNEIDLFISLYYDIAQIDLKRNIAQYKYTFARFMELGSLLGFTQEDIKSAYYSKNKTNHARQENNY